MKKKRILAIGSAALAAVLALSMAGCQKDPGPAEGLRDPYGIGGRISSVQVSALEGYTVAGVDASGIAMAYRQQTDDIEYALYDLNTGEMAQTASVEFMTMNGYTGFYYTIESETRGTAPDLTYTYTFTFYDGAEKVQTVSQGVSTFTVTDGIGTFEDGKVIYMDVTGKVYYGERGLHPIATLANAQKLGDFYVTEGSGSVYAVFDRAGKYLRTTDASVACALPDVSPSRNWQVGSRLFTQYRVPLPDDASDYDYYAGSTKYDLQTFYFDVVTGRGGELAVDLLVTGSQSSADPDRYAVLSGQKILKNKTLSEQTYLQTFDMNGKVYVDLQSLLPGASLMVSVGDGFLTLANDSQSNVYKNGYLYADISSFYEATWVGDGYFSDTSKETIYDAWMNEKYNLPVGAALQGVYGGGVYYTTEKAQAEASAPQYDLYRYDLSDRQAVRIGTLAGSESKVTTRFALTEEGAFYDLFDISDNPGSVNLTAAEAETAQLEVFSYVTDTACLYLLSVSGIENPRHYLATYDLTGSLPAYEVL